jgi:UDP-N-acetylglucosamine 4-epimerase
MFKIEKNKNIFAIGVILSPFSRSESNPKLSQNEVISVNNKKRWLVTGACGFIGTHLVEHLTSQGQTVMGVDNFSTGSRKNLDRICSNDFKFIEGDLRDLQICRQVTENIDIVLHQAALGSVPRSVEDPKSTHENNVDAFLNILIASHEKGVQRFVYASSSSVYGDNVLSPKQEDHIGRPLSPYALSKRIDEEYADLFYRVYGLQTIGLRYFNVFGPLQSPDGPYAAVIPQWTTALAQGKSPLIYGDGSNSRDFSYVDNIVQANILAGLTENKKALNRVFNIALGHKTTLLELFSLIKELMIKQGRPVGSIQALHEPPRKGDIPHSLADIRLAQELLGYAPTVSVRDGMAKTVEFFLEAVSKLKA